MTKYKCEFCTEYILDEQKAYCYIGNKGIHLCPDCMFHRAEIEIALDKVTEGLDQPIKLQDAYELILNIIIQVAMARVEVQKELYE